MYGVFFVIIIVLLALICLFIVKNIQKISFFEKINNKFLKWFLSILPLAVIFIVFGLVNGVVVVFHLFIFMALAYIVMNLIHKKVSKKKKLKYSTIVIIGFIWTVVYLLLGAYNCYHISRTDYKVITNKYLGKESIRIVQISDTHIGTTFDGKGFKKEIEKISKIDADLFVITGDFVDDDTSKEDMITSCEALSMLKPKYGVYYVFGNHDKGYYNYRGYSGDDLIQELAKNNVIVLTDEVVNINDYVYLIGRNDRSFNRKSIVELTQELDKSKYLIDLNHQPNDYENEKDVVDLVLSGHSHGGQLFPLGYIGKLSGENNEYYGLHKRGNTTFIVNSGMSNWELMFKTGTYSEYTVIDVIGRVNKDE